MTDQALPADVKATATRNIALLSVSQAIVGSNQAVVISVAALAGAALAPDPSLATVPTTAMVIGLALTASPATFTIHKLGRRNGFILGAALAIFGGIFAGFSLAMSSFVLFCGALVFMGASAAFGQQYRFAAADSVPIELKSRAISFVMLGGVLAGFVGPRFAIMAKDWVPDHQFAGSFFIPPLLASLAIVILLFTRLAPTAKQLPDAPKGRSLGQLIRAPEIFIPIVSAMASYALMTFVMVAAPLAMVYFHGHPVEAAAGAIQWHIVAMFGPSFFTGALIKRLGAHLVTGMGMVLILASAGTALSGISVLHFDFVLILLGVGWNFGFIGSTSLLTSAYRPEEAARAQGLNEQMVFGVMAMASIGSGLLLQLIGWESINIVVIPIATAVILLLIWGDIRQRRLAAAVG